MHSVNCGVCTGSAGLQLGKLSVFLLGKKKKKKMKSQLCLSALPKEGEIVDRKVACYLFIYPG